MAEGETTTNAVNKMYHIRVAHPNGINCFQTYVFDRENDAKALPIPTLEEDLFVHIDKLCREDRAVSIALTFTLILSSLPMFILWQTTGKTVFMVAFFLDDLVLLGFQLLYNYGFKIRMQGRLQNLQLLHPTILKSTSVSMTMDSNLAPVYTMVFETEEPQGATNSSTSCCLDSAPGSSSKQGAIKMEELDV